MSEVKRIHRQLERAFHEGAWIGPTVMSTLDGITAQGASMRPMANAHTIWEITNHIAFWNDLARRMLLEDSVDTTLESRHDWQPVEDRSEEAWHGALQSLLSSHQKLSDVVASLDESRLSEKSSETGTEFTVYDMLHGIVHHNIYHAGQIGMLKKSATFPSRKAPLLNASTRK